ncbi:hypothetical protein H4R35_003209 [Dimargaris xerosporica]|nr:hypothetical protein H4R35_003209 [Dimargaris xerosporica]
MYMQTTSLLALAAVIAATTVQAVDWIQSAKDLNSCVAQCHSTLEGQQAADCQLNCIHNSPYTTFLMSHSDSATTAKDDETTATETEAETETESTTESDSTTRTTTDTETEETTTTESEETNTDSGAVTLGLTAALLAPVAAALLVQH